jgi:hypothetical protein
LNKTNNKTKTGRFETRTLVSMLIFLGVIGFLIYAFLDNGTKQEDYSRKTLNRYLETYEKIKKTDLSKSLRNKLILIIKERKDCFSSQMSYRARSANCKRVYVNKIVQLARKEIHSAPMRGLFIRSVRECPISGSLCNGEEGTHEQKCIETEARCIEYFLDQYWRGDGFPYADSYTYKKNQN